MRVLFFTDLHGNTKHAEEVVNKSEEAELLAFCGDFTSMGSGFGEVIKELAKVKKPILVVPGNNETREFVKEGVEDYNNIFFIDAEVYQDENIRFLGIGGSTSTPFNTPYELTESEYEKKLSGFSNVDVLISHSPPKNTKLDETSEGMHVGSFSIKQWIKENQPKYCACGHVHENEGKEEKIGKTLCFNPGRTGRVIDVK